mgnify:FL=1
MKDELQKKIYNIDNISESQKDRIEAQTLVLNELLTFLKYQIEKVTAKETLRNSVISKLIERIEDNENEISTNQLLQLFAVLSKDENDAVANILSVVKDKQSTIINLPESTGKKSESHLSAEEIEKTKKLLSIMELVDKLKATELSLEELETKK